MMPDLCAQRPLKVVADHTGVFPEFGCWADRRDWPAINAPGYTTQTRRATTPGPTIDGRVAIPRMANDAPDNVDICWSNYVSQQGMPVKNVSCK